MTQSVDVNALFDRLALLVTGGGPGDGGLTLEARVAALERAVFSVPNTYIDGILFVITDATCSSSLATIEWDDPGIAKFAPDKLFDDDHSSSARFYLDAESNTTGFLFVEFDAGSVIDISGFAMQHLYNNRFYTETQYYVPGTTRLMARLSNSDPWTTIKTFILDSQPTTADPIQVLFQSQSYRYFRFEFDAIYEPVPGDAESQYNVYEFESIKLIAT